MKKFLLSLFATTAMFFSEKALAQCTTTIMSNTINICSGDTVVMSAPSGQQLYQWEMNGSPVGANYFMLHEIMNTPGTYSFTATVTDMTSCVSTSNTITVNVATGPMNVVASSNAPICSGGTLNLSASGTNITTYQWYGPGGWSSTLQNPTIPNVGPSNSGTYALYVTNMGSCSAYASTLVVVNGGAISVDAGANAGYCTNDILTLYGASSTGIVSPTYSWTGPNGFSSSTLTPNVSNNATVAMSGTYTLTVSGMDCAGNPISVSDNVAITVDTEPIITSVTNNGPVCQGSTIQLNGTVSNFTSLTWIGPNSYTSTQQNPTILNAQPANSGTYYLDVMNGGCYTWSSTNVSVLNSGTPTLATYTTPVICEGDSLVLYGYASNLSGITYSWAGPNSFSASNANATVYPSVIASSGTYTLTATGTGCAGPVTLTSTATASVVVCDSVWPGDANSDFSANYWDILHLGTQYGATGPVRSGANITWTAQYCADWGNIGIDNKHADCNGDGVVNINDTQAVYTNYGMLHSKGAHMPQAKSAAFPDLYFDMTGIALGAGGTFQIPIKLGTSALPMVNVYGVAAQVKVDGITPASELQISNSISWIGNTSNMFDFTKFISNNQTDWTIVRTDHNNVNGDGTIGVLTLNVPAGTEYQSVTLYFDNVKIIGESGVELTDYNVVDAAALVFPLSVGTAQVVNSIAIVPNPSDAHAELQLTLSADAKVQVVVTDITGRNMWSVQHNGVTGAQSIALPASQLAAGMYTIQVRDEQGAISQTMKWIKK